MTRRLAAGFLLAASLTACTSGSGSDEGEQKEEATRAWLTPVEGTGRGSWSHCSPPGRHLLVGVLAVKGEVTAGEPRADGVVRAWVTRPDHVTTDQRAILAGKRPPKRVARALGWKDREPLDGAKLTEGRHYYLLEVRGRPGKDIRTVAFPYTTASGERTGRREMDLKFRRSCG